MTESQQELLALAAKAIGHTVAHHGRDGALLIGIQEVWNPYTDDGDALRLGVKLRIELLHSNLNEWPHWVSAVVKNTTTHAAENYLTEDDGTAATRRAIARVAAEIGRSM